VRKDGFTRVKEGLIVKSGAIFTEHWGDGPPLLDPEHLHCQSMACDLLLNACGKCAASPAVAATGFFPAALNHFGAAPMPKNPLQMAYWNAALACPAMSVES